MNPYEPSQVTELANSQQPIPQFIPKQPMSLWRPIWKEWERRRWIYNGVLAIVVVSYSIANYYDWKIDGLSWGDYIVAALIANTAYLLGPFFEWCVSEEKQKRIEEGSVIFVLILIISVVALLVLIFMYELSRMSFG